MKYRNRLIALAMTLVCMIATEGLFGQDKKGDPSKGNQEKANPAKKSRPEPPGPEEPKKESPKTGEKKDGGKPMPAKEPMPAKDDGKKPAPKTGNWYIRSSPQMMKTLEPIVRQSTGTTVKVLANVKSRSKEQEQQVSLGTVVDAGGLILTKASQIYAKAKTLKVEINGKKVPAKVFGVDEDSDLALLKIEPAGLEIKPIQWQNQTPRVGHFLATPDSESKTIGFGVLSVASREERNTRGFMGVQLQDAADPKLGGALITRVTPKSPAQYAGLKAGDRIYQVDGAAVKNMQDLIAKVQKHKAGETVKIRYKRKDDDFEKSIKLANASGLGMERINPQETIAGNKLSKRRTGFERVIQHDTVLSPEQMGGPILDLEGRAIGVNIAKNGRVSTYALPLSVLQPVIAELKTGKLNPAVINKPKIEQLTRMIKEKEKEIADKGLEKAAEESAKKLEAAKKAMEEAAAEYERLQKELESAGNKKFKADESQKKLHLENRTQSRALSNAQKEIEELQKEKQELEDQFK